MEKTVPQIKDDVRDEEDVSFSPSLHYFLVFLFPLLQTPSFVFISAISLNWFSLSDTTCPFRFNQTVFFSTVSVRTGVLRITERGCFHSFPWSLLTRLVSMHRRSVDLKDTCMSRYTYKKETIDGKMVCS